MQMKWYAHTSQTKEWQLLKAHLDNVAQLARLSANKFNSEELAYIIGLLHDVGKYTEIFQRRLSGANQTTDHAIIGAKILKNYTKNADFNLLSTLLSYTIAGHHTGLPNHGSTANDTGTLVGRLAKNMPNYSAWQEEIYLQELTELLQYIPHLKIPHKLPSFSYSFWVRMLFSCLVDADFLDTEEFCDSEKAKLRQKSNFNYTYADKLHNFINEKSINSKQTSINTARKKIYDLCLQKAHEEQGAYSLTVPTGGGKTLSSMAFALEHIKKYQLDRVIYVIPYTSIIEQTAQVFREIFGNDGILEHHCNFVFDEENKDMSSLSLKLATENWESEIILTTAVQFFESLYAHKSSRCRKLHNIVNSVVIMDEAQMIPLPLLNPTILAIRELIANYKTSFLFCTATQPALSMLTIEQSGKKLLQYGFPKNEIKEIIPKEYLLEMFDLFKRTKIVDNGVLSLNKIASLLNTENQALCIVNSRKQAQKVFQSFSDIEGVFHLSTYMYPKHRKDVLETIRKRLTNKEKCIVISTSLIECGVDISFPLVLRAYSGLDSIAQASGRCNREGELPQGNVILFDFEQELTSRDSSLQRRIAMAKNTYQKFEEKLFYPEAIEDYFYNLYAYEDIDASNIIREFKENKIPHFNFKTISEEFCFIKNNQKPVLVAPQAYKEKELFQKHLEQIKFSGINKNLRQYFQQYTVQIYEHELKALRENGSVYLEGDVYVSFLGYDENMGLCPLEKYCVSASDLII